MAELALRLPIFLASPSDVKAERELADKAISNLGREAARHRLLLEPYRWEVDGQPGLMRPNDVTNSFLRVSELVVVLFWSRLGSAAAVDSDETGTLEELRLACNQVRKGSSDDVFVYFRNAPPPMDEAEPAARVTRFKRQLEDSKQVFFFQYGTPRQFVREFTRHLRAWVEEWYHLPDICQYALENSPPARVPVSLLGEARLTTVRRYFDYEQERRLTSALGSCAVALYQQDGSEGIRSPVPPELVRDHRLRLSALSSPGPPTGMVPNVISPSPFRRSANGEMFFFDHEWFSFFCACGLFDAIAANQIAAVKRRTYTNSVHQYLGALGQINRAPITPNLVSWLSNTAGVTTGEPIARNFAAYVLGMIGAVEAQDALADAARYDRGDDVDIYCIAALGKLRARRHLQQLTDVFFKEAFSENGSRKKILISQAICRSIGVAHYEL